jgi:hypothetical protein
MKMARLWEDEDGHGVLKFVMIDLAWVELVKTIESRV